MLRMRYRFGAIMLAIAVVAMVVLPPIADGWSPVLAQSAATPEIETPEVTDPRVETEPVATGDVPVVVETPVHAMPPTESGTVVSAAFILPTLFAACGSFLNAQQLEFTYAIDPGDYGDQLWLLFVMTEDVAGSPVSLWGNGAASGSLTYRANVAITGPITLWASLLYDGHTVVNQSFTCSPAPISTNTSTSPSTATLTPTTTQTLTPTTTPSPTATATSTPRVPSLTVSCGSYASDRELDLSYAVDLGSYPEIAWSLVPENDRGQADLAFTPQSVGSASSSPLRGTVRYTANQSIDWSPSWSFRLTINGASSITEYVSCSPTTLPSPTATSVATATATRTATPSGPPPLTLNGGTTSLTVPLGATVNVLTDPNALFNVWTGSACSQYGAGQSQTYYSAITRTTPQSMAFRAFWPGVAGNTGACLTVTWEDPATATTTSASTATATPTDVATVTPIRLWVQGMTSSFDWPVGAPVLLTTDPPGVPIGIWPGTQCNGDPEGSARNDEYFTWNAPGSLSFQAYSPDAPGSRSACITVTWQQPPTATATATSTTASTATTAATATASATNTTSATVTATNTATATATATPAETRASTETTTATATEIATNTPAATSTSTPGDPPGFTLNGQRGSIVVVVGERVSVVPDDGTFISRYLTGDCSGEDYGPIEAPYRFSLDEPTVRSFRGYLADDPTQQTECLTVTSVWPATATATATSTATSTSTSVPTATSATEVPTATPTGMTTSTPTETSEPTETPTAMSTATPTETPAPTETVTGTAVTTATLTPSEVPSPTPIQTEAATQTVIPASGSVIVRVETTDGSALPDGLQACVDGDCLLVGALASVQVMSLVLPSGAGVAFFDIPVGVHMVTLQDASNAELNARLVSVIHGEATEVTFILGRQPISTATVAPSTATPGTTSMTVSNLPNTGHGHGKGMVVSLLLLILSVLAGMAAHGLRRNRPARP